MRFLIAGLGNPGSEYANTRHNIGYRILDALADASNIVFKDRRYGFVAELSYNEHTLIVLKPTTFMNLSGLAINYWLKKECIKLENLLVLNDDLALPFGLLRLKPKGSAGGHNGLRNIEDVLGSNQYARLRFGIGSNFSAGQQFNFVLGQWTRDEQAALPERIEVCIKIVESFVTAGVEKTMTQFNGKS
ncbi:MAG: aminoacyl-tRNA hydrolase [Bacteroidales bacterium]|jgi:PTH1 family peptidyl-tRNA hydrolase|nr:aminoacyl-tRNA hydrolase [Bacteroidales bacterium]